MSIKLRNQPRLSRYVIASLFIHLFIFYLLGSLQSCVLDKNLANKGDGEGTGSGKENLLDTLEIVPIKKLRRPEKRVVDKDLQTFLDELEKEFTEEVNEGTLECQSFYGGLGILIESESNNIIRVIKVVPGYPGHRNGLKSGDKILDSKNGTLRGKIGTVVNFTVFRNGKTLQFSIVREKICTADL